MSIIHEMGALILEKFGFQPTEQQAEAVECIASFLLDTDRDSAFLLRGYAGTGKTSLVGAVVKALGELKHRVVLMAPTGRAAKVFSLHAEHTAFTIHKRIYRQKSFSGEMIDFLQGVNLMKHTLFIVDEASMISNEGLQGQAFGSGHLLDDLVQFVYSGEGCRLMLVGDTAQLPPVGEELSPALSADMLAGYGLQVTERTLSQVVRQMDTSGVLFNATLLRQLLSEGDWGAFPQLRLAGFSDVINISGADLIEALEHAYHDCGTDQTIVITRSNARANRFNQGIRARVFNYEEELTGGDQVMIVKNNYHWGKPDVEAPLQDASAANEPQSPSPSNSMDFIANGDIATVRRVRWEREEHGFRFVDLQLSFPDYEDLEVEATTLLNTLHSEAPALTRAEQEQLFQSVWNDYPEFHNKRDRMKAVKEDSYFNALQIKYAYAVTCHKAQGGQWQRVFVDQGYLTEEMLTPDYFRWLYTAVTRATETLYLINWPSSMLDADSKLLMTD